ncbi:MAG TPA: beta-N-acetylhexosaminidase, partial [Terriglobales bacterium]|nr:beta-N-acetylhexosaminidase [Terriglobales bacterium]
QTARNFAIMVDHLLAGQASPVEKTALRRWLEIWRDNNALLAPTLRNSSLLQEDAGLSQSLARVAEVGLQALDVLEGHLQADAALRAQQLATLEDATKPQAELQLMIVEPVRKLVLGYSR